jgi:hypothetical protein
MRPSHAAATPIEARNAGISVVAISWDQFEKRLVRPIPSTVRFNQRMRAPFLRSEVEGGAFIAVKDYCESCQSAVAARGMLTQHRPLHRKLDVPDPFE